MSILYVGIDLAKNVFAIHGVNQSGAAESGQPKVARAKLHALIASLPPRGSFATPDRATAIATRPAMRARTSVRHQGCHPHSRSPRPAITKRPLDALRRAFGQRLDERALDASLRDAAAIDQGLQRFFQRA